jgi:hypothetical protein
MYPWQGYIASILCFGLGHGHSMAVYALLKGVKSENRNDP